MEILNTQAPVALLMVCMTMTACVCALLYGPNDFNHSLEKTNLIWSTCLHHAILQNNDR